MLKFKRLSWVSGGVRFLFFRRGGEVPYFLAMALFFPDVVFEKEHIVGRTFPLKRSPKTLLLPFWLRLRLVRFYLVVKFTILDVTYEVTNIAKQNTYNPKCTWTSAIGPSFTVTISKATTNTSSIDHLP
jgi:hypothetical protein